MRKLRVITPLGWLLIISFAIRLVLACAFPLGNDEAYYYVYAKFPNLSHFDHPGMVGWIIQLFTLNLLISSELFVRLAVVVLGTFNTWLIYFIALKLWNSKSAFIAALLCTFNLYGFIITGIFILPDAPLTTFWLLAFYFFVNAFFIYKDNKIRARYNFLWACLFTALALMSKYTAAFLWIGSFAFVVIYRRKWLKTRTFYIGQSIIMLSLLPTLIWNINNNFVSFAFHGSRVAIGSPQINWQYFIQFVGGNALYTNPFIFVSLLFIIVLNIKHLFKKQSTPQGFILYLSLPIIFVFIVASLYEETLPHWNGVGYLMLSLLLAEFISKRKRAKLYMGVIAAYFFAFILVVPLQIKTGFIPIEKISKNKNLIIDDFSLELYGWDFLNDEFVKLAKQYEKEGLMQKGAPILASRWFPAANYEYYIERKSPQHVVYAYGDTIDIHEYAWINNKKPIINKGSDAYYLTSSIDYRPLGTMTGIAFEQYSTPDTIRIYRCNKNVYDFYVYRLNGMLYSAYR